MSEMTKTEMLRAKAEMLRVLLTQDLNQRVKHPRTGQPVLLGEFLAEEMRGEAAIVHIPSEPRPAAAAGGSVIPSQAAIDALPQHTYDELERTGVIDGFTRPFENVPVAFGKGWCPIGPTQH